MSGGGKGRGGAFYDIGIRSLQTVIDFAASGTTGRSRGRFAAVELRVQSQMISRSRLSTNGITWNSITYAHRPFVVDVELVRTHFLLRAGIESLLSLSRSKFLSLYHWEAGLEPSERPVTLGSGPSLSL